MQIHRSSDFLITLYYHLPVSNIFQIVCDVLRHILGVILEAIGIHDLSSSTYNIEGKTITNRCNDIKNIH